MEDYEVESLVSRMDALVARTPKDFHRALIGKIDWNNRLLGIKGARGASNIQHPTPAPRTGDSLITHRISAHPAMQ